MAKLSSLTSLVVRRKSQPKHRFFNLPSEIRNVIYSLVFVNISEEVIIPITATKRSLSQKLRRLLTPHDKRVSRLALLMTCRKIHREAFGYVHGVVSARLELHTHRFWVITNLVTGHLRRDIERALQDGGKALPFAKHLHLVGRLALLLLLRVQDNSTITRARDSTDLLERRAAELVLTLATLRHHLANVECITFRTRKFDVWLSGPLLLDGPAWRIFRITGQGRLGETAFPKLREVRIETPAVGVRIRRVENGSWQEWYTGSDTVKLS